MRDSRCEVCNRVDGLGIARDVCARQCERKDLQCGSKPTARASHADTKVLRLTTGELALLDSLLARLLMDRGVLEVERATRERMVRIDPVQNPLNSTELKV